MRNFIDNTRGDPIQQRIGEMRVGTGHKIAGDHCAHGNGIVIGASVAHYADASGIGQYGKILMGFRAGAGNLFPYNGIGFSQNI